MDNRQKLIEYLPEHLQKFKELQEINRVLQTQIDAIANRADDIVKNCFINDADSDSLAHYERMYDVTRNPEDNNILRATRICMKLYSSKINNIQNLYRRVDELCGNDDYSISYDPKINSITINTSFEDPSKYVEFCEYIDATLPMNMFYSISNDFNRTLSVGNSMNNVVIRKKASHIGSEVL